VLGTWCVALFAERGRSGRTHPSKPIAEQRGTWRGGKKFCQPSRAPKGVGVGQNPTRGGPRKKKAGPTQSQGHNGKKMTECDDGQTVEITRLTEKGGGKLGADSFRWTSKRRPICEAVSGPKQTLGNIKKTRRTQTTGSVMKTRLYMQEAASPDFRKERSPLSQPRGKTANKAWGFPS